MTKIFGAIFWQPKLGPKIRSFSYVKSNDIPSVLFAPVELSNARSCYGLSTAECFPSDVLCGGVGSHRTWGFCEIFFCFLKIRGNWKPYLTLEWWQVQRFL